MQFCENRNSDCGGVACVNVLFSFLYCAYINPLFIENYVTFSNKLCCSEFHFILKVEVQSKKENKQNE